MGKDISFGFYATYHDESKLIRNDNIEINDNYIDYLRTFNHHYDQLET